MLSSLWDASEERTQTDRQTDGRTDRRAGTLLATKAHIQKRTQAPEEKQSEYTKALEARLKETQTDAQTVKQEETFASVEQTH